MNRLFPRGDDPLFDAVLAQGVVDSLANRDDAYIQEQILPLIGAADTVEVNGRRVANVPRRGTLRMANASFGEAGLRVNVAPGESTPIVQGIGTTALNYEVGERRAGARVTSADIDTLRTNAGVDAIAFHLRPVVDTLKTRREQEVALLYSTAANWASATTLALGDCWDQATSTPLVDMLAAKRAVEDWGVSPNVVILGRASAEALKTNPDFLQFLPMTVDRGAVTDDDIKARLMSKLGVKLVLVGKARANTALAPGAVTLADIWGDMAWIGYLPLTSTGSLATLGSFGRGTSEAGVIESSATYLIDRAGWEFDEFRDEDTKVIVPRVQREDVFGVMRRELGAIILNTVL